MSCATPWRLVQVLTNLLHNAARYSEPGGRITLTLAREAGFDAHLIKPVVLDRVRELVADAGGGGSGAPY